MKRTCGLPGTAGAPPGPGTPAPSPEPRSRRGGPRLAPFPVAAAGGAGTRRGQPTEARAAHGEPLDLRRPGKAAARKRPTRCGLCPESSPSAAAGSAASEPARPASSRRKAAPPARAQGLQPPPQGAPRVHHPAPAQPPGRHCGGHVVFYVPGA